ncbi:nicotinate-nucleotide--dimethylbenzimidazole phosphoribosyltransferase [Ruminiclostridium cellobioparum]|uniref:Nicotinate-nucleotide--dimethylbenzimidazole phosphoribosyltransferase n=1 Tax=Ruminiclostridium cellobioparum subsp. termitidis CT1112 TaxID=1195236 RepID=S0FS25_RUMCE|nr:nicotinate-nucleotide--dimethylbenzimidazole phosphoribosyltransferase [Ruminiclostridium cellobioparum]EMS73146.1 nicotinate-nucleotide-- dimethylbenzimidazolephos phoribosyltransferase [Ruminiclostridium cellobioparum subsp. termitidis CT1112]
MENDIFGLQKITPLDQAAMRAAQIRWDNRTKPLGSLGRLEDIVVRLAGINGTPDPRADKRAVVIMCADNGVVEENVSSCPKSVTASVTCNFIRGITGINVFSRLVNASLKIVDIGVDADLKFPGIIDRKIRKGTWNMADGPAMTREEAVKGILTGIEVVRELKEAGIHIFATGEMGIGNTSTSCAISAVLTGIPVDDLAGLGSGLSKEAYLNKIRVIRRAIEINEPQLTDPVDVLAKVGGFDIAGLAGCFLGAAIYKIPAVIDGFISAAAALAAFRIHPAAKDYMLPSHGSAEQGFSAVMEALDLEPMLNLGMRLGEGTGAALGLQLVDAALAAYNQMGSFEDASIEQYVPQE